MSDRGADRPPPEVLAEQHREDLARFNRGEPADIRDSRFDNIRTLTREDINALGERYGVERTAAEIAARAAVQLANVKLEVDNLPNATRVRLISETEGMTPEERDHEFAYERRRQAIMDVSAQLRHEAVTKLVADVFAIVGDEERAERLVRAMGEAGIRRVLATPKYKRRVALARELESCDADA